MSEARGFRARGARSVLRVVTLLLAIGSGLPQRALADEASGSFTGYIEARLNYYLERSTRVYMPAVRSEVEAPNGIRVRGAYALDVISSASIAQTGGEVDAVFTELRHGIGAMGVAKKFDTGKAELDIGMHGTYSIEDDYRSWIYGLVTSLALDEKNTTISLALTRVDDTIEKNSDPDFSERLGGTTVGVGVEQLLSPVLKLNVGYQFSYLEGFLGNVYRTALVGGTPDDNGVLMGGLPQPELPPEERARHNFEAQLAWYLPDSWTTLQLYYRTYFDSWEIKAQTPELRVYQQFGPDFLVRGRYRFYTQTRAYFAPEEGQTRYPVGYAGPVTSDPKMTTFHSHQVGLQLAYRLSFLSDSFLGFAESATIDLSVDRQFCTSSFGNNWIATAGGRLPF